MRVTAPCHRHGRADVFSHKKVPSASDENEYMTILRTSPDIHACMSGLGWRIARMSGLGWRIVMYSFSSDRQYASPVRAPPRPTNRAELALHWKHRTDDLMFRRIRINLWQHRTDNLHDLLFWRIRGSIRPAIDSFRQLSALTKCYPSFSLANDQSLVISFLSCFSTCLTLPLSEHGATVCYGLCPAIA